MTGTLEYVALLNAAIAAANADAANTGDIVVELGGDIALSSPTTAITLAGGNTLIIEGVDHVLNGDNKNEGLFVESGTILVENLSIDNSVAQGGAGVSNGGGGSGGFGGGGGGGSPGLGGGGGGGLGAGGEIFVQQGRALDVTGGTASAGTVTGGSGNQSGAAYGSGIFLQSNETITLSPGAGQTTTIPGNIADETGSHDSSGQTGAGGLIIDGAGTVALDPLTSATNATPAANTFTGGATLESGTLELGQSQAAGSGTNTYTANATLKLDAGVAPANTISGFSAGDVIDLAGLAFVNSQLVAPTSANVTVTQGAASQTLNFAANPGELVLARDGAGGTLVGAAATSYTDISTAEQLSAAITAIDLESQAATGAGQNYTISLAANATITENLDLEAVNIRSADTLVIQGDDATLDGANAYAGLFVYAGAVTVDNLTIADAEAVGGDGGAASYGGGGGAGLGGGLFVGEGGDVSLTNVSFADDSAKGGNGAGHIAYGYGGGGGLLGGDGASSKGVAFGAGGGGGVGAAGGAPGEAGSAGLIPGLGGGSGAAGAAGGTSGGGGGGGSTSANFTSAAAGGGGVAGGAGASNTSGAGGFGGGGGGGVVRSDDGGFGGGGGGSGEFTSGKGGFGGGGGANHYTSAPGGFGGGSGNNNAGGGGLGAGGDIFVQAGATLNIVGGTLGAGAVTGGSGANSGSAYGAGIFLQGDETITLGVNQPNGWTTYVDGVIADETGSNDASADKGAGTLVIGGGSTPGEGAGVVDLAPVDSDGDPTANTFTGRTTIAGGTLVLSDAAAAGSGAIAFTGANTHLQIQAALTAPFVNAITGFALGDSIDLTGLGFANGATASLSGSTLSVVSGGVTDTLTLTLASGLPGGLTVGATSDGAGGAEVILADAPTITGAGTSGYLLTGTSSTPLTGVTIGDQNPGADDTVTLTLSDPTATLSDNAAIATSDNVSFSGTNGVYTLSGATAGVNAVLQSLTFKGTASGALDPVTITASVLSSAGTLAGPAAQATVTVVPTTFDDVATAGALSDDIMAIDLASLGSTVQTNFTINLASGGILTESADLKAINLKAGDTLTIQGAGATLDGASAYEGLFVYAGQVTVDNLIIANAKAVGGNGGNGGQGRAGGAGAGLGGGLFVGGNVVGDAGDVTLDNVSFTGDSAVGGRGGIDGPGNGSSGTVGGGGGLNGGAGGNGGSNYTEGGGGGIGLSASGSSSSSGNGGAGIVPGAGPGFDGTLNYATAGGASAGGGGSAATAGGGGGAGATGNGGFGGGGGGYIAGSNRGGFGGGGAGNKSAGGFGGGGGAGGGSGGFGGGAGETGNGGTAGGGGGLGAGGDIFVQAGASLDVIGGTQSAGTVTGGAGANSGAAYGSGIFLQGDETITLAANQPDGWTTYVEGVIADETGSNDASGDQGAGALIIGGGSTPGEGAGYVYLAPVDSNSDPVANTFTGGIQIAGGTLELASAAAAGSGAIAFTGADTNLQLRSGLSAPFANAITGFALGDSIDLLGLTYAAGASASLNGSTLSVVSGGVTDTLNLTLAAGLPGRLTVDATSDGAGGAEVTLVYAPTISGTLARQMTTSEAPISPFVGVTIGDANAGADDTLTITQTGAGTLAGAGLTPLGGGVYTLSGSDDVVTSELDALIFTPTPGAQGSASNTSFSLSDVSSAGSAATATTNVADIDPSLVLGGFAQSAITDAQTVDPFAATTISDTVTGDGDAATISFTAANGTLSGAGLSAGTIDGGVATYTLTATDAVSLQGELQALTFTPTAHQVAPGSNVTTGFTLSVTGAPTAPSWTTSDGVSNPHSVATDAAGDVFVANFTYNTVEEFSASGTLLNTLSNGVNNPFSVATDAAGDVFVANLGNSNVEEFSASGALLRTLSNGLSDPYSLATDAAGDVFVGDIANNNVKEFSASGALLRTLSDGVSDPVSVATDAAGDVFVANNQNSTVEEFSASGALLRTLSTGVSNPLSVATDAAGDVFVANSGNSTVEEFSASGVQLNAPSIAVNGPVSVATDAAGDVFVANGGRDMVEEFSASGALLRTLSSGNNPQSVATDAAGDVFVANYGDSTVEAFAPIAAAQDSTTTVTVTAVVPPTISGVTDSVTTFVGSPAAPFAGVSVGDGNANAQDTVTISVSGAGGALADGAGFSNLTILQAGVTYTLTGAALALSQELDALVFTPTTTAGQQSTSYLDFSDLSSADATPTSTYTTSVIDNGAGVPVTVAQYVAHLSALDAAGGIVIADSWLNILAALDSLSADSAVVSIRSTDVIFPPLTIDAEQAQNGARALGLITASSPYSLTVQDSAAHIAGLLGETPAQLQSLAAASVTLLQTTDTGVTLTVAQALALEGAGIGLQAPVGVTNILADTAAQLETLTPADINALTSLSVGRLVATDAAVVLSVAQMSALGTLGITLDEPASHGAQAAVSYNSDGSINQIEYTGVTGAPYTYYTVDYGPNDKPARIFYSNGEVANWTYNGDGSLYEIDYTGVTGTAYKAYQTYYGTNGKPSSTSYSNGLTKTITYNLDDTLHDTDFTGITGTNYSAEDVTFNAGGTTHDIAYSGITGTNFTGRDVTFNADGTTHDIDYTGFTGTDYSAKDVTYNADGTLHDVRLTGVTGTNYSGRDVTYNANGSVHDISYTGVTGKGYTFYDVVYDANGEPASATYSGGTSKTWTYEPNGDYEIASMEPGGSADISLADIYSLSNIHLAQARDINNAGESGSLQLLANNEGVSKSGVEFLVETGSNIYDLNTHATESIIATNSQSDTFALATGFGQMSIAGFGTGDTLNFQLSMFDPSYFTSATTPDQEALALLNHATGATNTVIVDSANDKLTLVGVSVATLKNDLGAILFS